jgi:hypothetical protein
MDFVKSVNRNTLITKQQLQDLEILEDVLKFIVSCVTASIIQRLMLGLSVQLVAKQKDFVHAAMQNGNDFLWITMSQNCTIKYKRVVRNERGTHRSSYLRNSGNARPAKEPACLKNMIHLFTIWFTNSPSD